MQQNEYEGLKQTESVFVNLKEENERLKQTLSDMRGVLKFYGNRRMYYKHSMGDSKVIEPVLQDGGERAREVLRDAKTAS